MKSIIKVTSTLEKTIQHIDIKILSLMIISTSLKQTHPQPLWGFHLLRLLQFTRLNPGSVSWMPVSHVNGRTQCLSHHLLLPRVWTSRKQESKVHVHFKRSRWGIQRVSWSPHQILIRHNRLYFSLIGILVLVAFFKSFEVCLRWHFLLFVGLPS